MPNDTDEIDESQYFSVYVPGTQDSSASQYHYLRLGMPDTSAEGNLPADPNVPQGSTDITKHGITLYTTGTYSVTAPSVNSWSSDSLSAVIDGSNLYTATYTTGAANGMRPATVTYQNVDQLTNTAAASVNFLNGDALTYWNGNDQSLGLGGLLWANYGFTTNLFGGSIINLTNNSAEVQGIGSFKVTDRNTISAAEAIVLSVSPVAALADITALVNKYTAVMAALTLTATGMTAAMTGELKQSGLSASSLKTTMNNLYDQQIAGTTLVTFIQALSLLLAIRLQAEQFAAGEGVNTITLDEFGIRLESGVNVLEMTQESISMFAGPTMLMVDAAGFIVEADESVMINAAESSFFANATGVSINGPSVDVLPI